jgi:hypothetical protein
MERPQDEPNTARRLELFQGLNAVKYVRGGGVASTVGRGLIQVAREGIALGEESCRQGDALWHSPALSLHQQPADAWVDRQSGQRPAQVRDTLFDFINRPEQAQ